MEFRLCDCIGPGNLVVEHGIATARWRTGRTGFSPATVLCPEFLSGLVRCYSSGGNIC